ncbi:hypothetical protein BGZ93_009491 [Podila epicladia]|nr:hypothetical protein BGZ92_002949 [Podila epicladia]KAG0090122.1 hypothetical protein BGZ93_009491 [Podila epicladia]
MNSAYFLKRGIGNVAALVEAQKALMMVVVSDVPFCILREKMRLGTLVHKKATLVVALTAVHPEHEVLFAKVLEITRESLEEQLGREKEDNLALGNNKTDWGVTLSKEIMMFRYNEALKKF